MHSPSSKPSVLKPSDTQARIQAYLRVAAARGRDTEQVGPFLATFTRRTDNPFLNYAIPDDGADPTDLEAAALTAAFERHGRRPRLEYAAALAPAVEPVLVRAGFVAEARMPLMTCTPGAERPQPVPAGIEMILPHSDAELLGMVAAQNEAYGDMQPTPEDAARLRASLAAGTIAVLARDAETKEAAGAGVCTGPQNGLTEVAAIGVRPAFRRRGIAGALATRLTREAFSAGVTLAFLMAAHEVEERIYARAGFTPAGEILHISHP